MKNELDIRLSVVETMKKYSYDPTETTYGDNSIVSYGADNTLPYLLRNCYLQSATLKSAIDASVAYILGEEVIVGDNLADYRDSINQNGMTMRQFIAGLAHSYMCFGGFAFQVIYSKLGTVTELYPLDFTKCRTNASGSKIFYSRKGWTKYSTKTDVFDRFNKNNFNPEKPTQIFYFKGDYTPNVYPVPCWFGALNDVLTEIECGKYALNSVGSGFQARYVLNIPDAANLTKEQKEEYEKRIKEKFCGGDTSSNFMLYFAKENNLLSVEKIETDDAPEQFIAIKDNARSNIYTSMRLTPNLVGLPTATTGFNEQEYSSAFKLFQKTVIKPIQDMLCEAINKVLSAREGVIITPFKIEFKEDE